MPIEQIRELLGTEVLDMRRHRERLLTLIAIGESFLDLPPSTPGRVVTMERGGEMSEEERALWLNRRRAWLMELAAIETYMGTPRTVPPKAERQNGRIAHGVDGRGAHNGNGRQGGPM